MANAPLPPLSTQEALDRLMVQDSSAALLGEAVRLLHERLGFMASAYHVNTRDDQLVIVAYAGVPDEVIQVSQRLGQQVDLVWEVLRSGEPVNVPILMDELAPDLVNVALREGMRNTAILPMSCRGESWGLFFLSRNSPILEQSFQQGWELVRLVATLDYGLRTRARLQRSESLLQAVSNFMKEGVIAGTGTGDLLLYNPALERLSGWPIEDVRSIGWMNLAYPDPVYRAHVMASIRRLLKQESSEAEWVITRKGGGHVRARIASRGLPDPVDGGTVVVGVMEDITNEHKERQQSLRDAAQRRFGEVADEVAQSLRALLLQIRGPSGAEFEALPPAEQTHRAQALAQSVERALELLDQLSALHQAPSTRPVALDLVAAVQAAVEPLELSEHGVQLELPEGAQDSLPPVEAEPELLSALLQTTLAFLSPELCAGRLRLEEASPPVQVSFRGQLLRDPPSWLRLELRDGGPPLDADTLLHPFGLSGPRGQGLRLALLREQLDMLGGALELLELDGLCLRIYLPTSRRALAPDALERGLGARGDERIWHLDEEPAMTEFVAATLESRGYEQRSFWTAEELLEAVALGPAPHLLVLNPVMPGLCGAALIRELQARGLSVPVLWSSAYTPAQAAVELDETMEFLTKPYAGSELADAARRLLDRRLSLRLDR